MQKEGISSVSSLRWAFRSGGVLGAPSTPACPTRLPAATKALPTSACDRVRPKHWKFSRVRNEDRFSLSPKSLDMKCHGRGP